MLQVAHQVLPRRVFPVRLILNGRAPLEGHQPTSNVTKNHTTGIVGESGWPFELISRLPGAPIAQIGFANREMHQTQADTGLEVFLEPLHPSCCSQAPLQKTIACAPLIAKSLS